ncbi:hypothetical protein RSAG8_08309, partial [Rhizoctonia solani AG-8 WAC10335]
MTLYRLYPARIQRPDNTKQALVEHMHPPAHILLVSRSNPASRQYQTGSGGTYAPTGTYPPPQNTASPGTAQPMDPFFDDDDDDDANPFGDGRGNPFTDKHAASGNSAGNTYGMSTPNLGLAANAAPPAGAGASSSTVALGKDGMPPGWAFDDDDEPVNAPATSRSAPASSSGGGLKATMKKTGGGWKWPWTKEKVLEGERNVWLNDQARNIGEGYPNNYYNLVTFIPKFLIEQFSKYANVFFLFTAFIQQVPGVSPTNRYTTIAPLALVLLASAFKEVSEDLKRHQSDAELNSRTCQVLDPNTVSFAPKAWKDVRVGDLIRLESDNFIPADMLLISMKGFVEDILTFVILYNNLIPISLIVTMEVVKYQQAQLINSDLDMYYAKTDTPALCRTSSLVEELGQIEYIFSDKTGTLTCNEMEFRQASIAGVAYSDVVDESKRGEVDENGQVTVGQRTFAELRELERAEGLTGGMSAGGSGGSGGGKEVFVIREFLSLLAVCHTVIPEMRGEKMVYQASSPDEAALVAGAELLGYKFYQRKPKSVFVEIGGVSQQFDILNVCEFNSTRKRMSTVVRGPDGKIKLYCKGADTVILERLSKNQPYTEQTLVHLEDYATEGLRTLCLAMREIPEAEYQQWSVLYDQAAATINGRGDALDKAAEIIEKEMFMLGATAIEDKLQEGVPETIHTLQMAGIK